MTLLGIGIFVIWWLIPFTAIVLFMQFVFEISMPYCNSNHLNILNMCATIILFVGLVFYGISAAYLLRNWPKGSIRSLETRGPFRVSRNPMYFCFIFLFIPSISMFLNNVILLLASVIFLYLFFIYIKREEFFLFSKFGEKYKEYSERTPLLIPFLKT